MSSFVFSNKKLEIGNLNFQQLDNINSWNIDEFNIIYHLDDISKNDISYYINDDNITLLFDGWLECNDNILLLYKEYGKDFIEHINGEYAIIILDFNKNIIYMYSDIFAIKSLFYSIEDGNIGIATYASKLKLLGFNNIIRINDSSIIELNLNDYLVQQYKHNQFNFDEYKTSYDDCIAALENAIKIRCNQRCAVGLSSGYDTGVLLQWSLLNDKRDNIFYHLTNNREDSGVMEERFKKCKVSGLQHKIIDYYKNKTINDLIEFKKISNMEDFEVYKDENSMFMLSRLMSTMKKDGINIFVTGTGADDIMTNDQIENEIGIEYSLTDGAYFYNSERPFYFYSDITRESIDQCEYACRAHGVQAKYPFFDKFFVQEFLNLSPELKTQQYKSVISEYLKIHNLSVQSRKTGMSCSNAIHKSIKTNFIL
jgi:asparagine synthetase B (glutamine-hydrolysing)